MLKSFNFIQKLGEGTFGTVHLCERKHNKLKVVLKEIKLEATKERLEISKNEVSVLKSLNHPNIVKYFDSFQSKGTFYIVMEFSANGTLYDFIKRQNSLIEEKEVISIFCQILAGLHHMHSKNIIHRDLKTQNVFLTGEHGLVVKIGDFGISKMLKNETETSTVIGTTNYLAPELCQGHPYGLKTDIWTLGLILYELCALERMFEGPLANVILSILYSGERKVIDVTFYNQELHYVIEACLESDPNNRPDTTNIMQLSVFVPTFYTLGANLGCIFNDIC